MSNADRVIDALRKRGPLSDSQLVTITGIRPHQQINQLCHKLEQKGVLRRVPSVGGTITNVLTGVGPEAERPVAEPRLPARVPQRVEPRPETRPTSAPLVTESGLFIIPCSGDKRDGGRSGSDGPKVFDLMDNELAERLRRARTSLKTVAAMDESLLMPAWQRYQGTLYESAGSSLGQAISHGANLVILSGGYGVLLGTEPIGTYNRQFKRSDWPPGLLRRCVEAIVTSLGVARVLAFCSRTTDYATVVREVGWRRLGVEASLITPDLGGRGGGQVFVPRASGEAIRDAFANTLTSQWRSSDGLGNAIERLG